MDKIKKLILPFIFFNLLVLDGAVIYLAFYKKAEIISNTLPSTSQNIYQDTCGPDCQKYITDQISQIKLATPSPVVKTTYVAAPTPVKTATVSYVPVPGSGNTLNNDWTDVPGTDFYFDVSNYSGLQSIYFETNIRLLNGNGQVSVRLFDVTHGIGVQGSEADTANQASTAVDSGQVSFYQGNNLYRVQLKSLTADTAIFDSGRLKITTQN